MRIVIRCNRTSSIQVKDGICKRIEFAIEDVFDICAIINADLDLGTPGGG